MHFLSGFFIFLLGSCIGSFLNCAVYRLEENKSMLGRSFCPHCKHNLGWKDLFPIFSFFALRRKCRYCAQKISWQYPLVEILTGLMFVLILSAQGGPASGWNLIFLFYIASVLIIIFIYDLKHYLIPDKILLPAIAIAFVYRLFYMQSFMDYFWAGLLASGFFFVIFFISQGRWMGFGDVKLAVLMGFVLGIKGVLTALFIAFFSGAIIGIIAMILPASLQGGKKKGLKSEMPFAPFLIAGTFFALFFGRQIIEWYFNLLI